MFTCDFELFPSFSASAHSMNSEHMDREREGEKECGRANAHIETFRPADQMGTLEMIQFSFVFGLLNYYAGKLLYLQSERAKRKRETDLQTTKRHLMS